MGRKSVRTLFWSYVILSTHLYAWWQYVEVLLKVSLSNGSMLFLIRIRKLSKEGQKRCHKASKFLKVNPLNAQLNPICHLPILLGDLTFISPCIISIFQYISNKLQSYTIYLYLETILHVSGGSSTHHQKCIQLYLQHLVFVTPLLLSAAIVEELEPVWVCCGWQLERSETFDFDSGE
jgi:hypothetical protein